MDCRYVGRCEHCFKDSVDECPYDHMGDGTAYCREFLCAEDECKRTNCIDEEEHYYELDRM